MTKPSMTEAEMVELERLVGGRSRLGHRATGEIWRLRAALRGVGVYSPVFGWCFCPVPAVGADLPVHTAECQAAREALGEGDDG